MMIELPQRCFIGRVNPRWFARVRPIYLNYTGSETLSNFQVRCSITSSDIPFEKLRSDRQDLLFVDENNEMIPYWIESVGNDEIITWLKFPEIQKGRKVFWLYFGNTGFRGLSNGSEVFLFCDDFNDNDISDWETGDGVDENFNTKPVVENGYVKSPSDTSGMHKSISLPPLETYILGLRIYFSGDDGYNYLWSGLIKTGGTSAEYYSHLCTQGSPAHEGMQITKDDFWSSEKRLAEDRTEEFTGDVWHTVEFIHKPDGRWAGTHNGQEVDFEYLNKTDTSYSSFSSINLCFRLANQRCDHIYIRKYAEVEPIIEL